MICIVTPVAIAKKHRRNVQCDVTKTAQYSRVIHRVDMETIFTLSGIALCLMKLVIYGPSFGWFMSQSYSLRFPRRNSAAASNSSGVVGNTGRNAPSTPSPSEINPNMVSNTFI